MDIGAAAGIQSLPHKMLDYPSRAHAPENATLSSSSSSSSGKRPPCFFFKYAIFQQMFNTSEALYYLSVALNPLSTKVSILCVDYLFHPPPFFLKEPSHYFIMPSKKSWKEASLHHADPVWAGKKSTSAFAFCSLLTPNTISQTPTRHPYCTYQINPTCWGKLNQATASEKIAVMLWGINATKCLYTPHSLGKGAFRK